jgi:hypothetical protein
VRITSTSFITAVSFRAELSEHLPLIVVEIVLVFGGALAFAWWQFRDLDRERKKREEKERQEEGKGEGSA